MNEYFDFSIHEILVSLVSGFESQLDFDSVFQILFLILNLIDLFAFQCLDPPFSSSPSPFTVGYYISEMSFVVRYPSFQTP